MRKMVLLVAATLAAVAAVAQDKPQVFMVGDYEVCVLVEGRGAGDTGILIDPPQAVLAKYAPDGTFPIATNAVLIRKSGEVWLVDTGYDRNIFENMAAIGVAPEEVDHVMLTHMHGDHIGGMLRDGKKVFPNADVIVSRKEYDYWSDSGEMDKLPEGRRGGFRSAQKVFSEYDDRLLIVDPYDIKAKPKDGIRPVAAYGHTPGHVMFMVQDGGRRLLIWSDLTHALAIQMPHPEISVTYDVYPDMARQSRMEVLKRISEKEGRDPAKMITVVGMHVPATTPGVIYTDGSGYGFHLPEL